MKKALSAVVLVAFMGAVAFASLESRNTNTKQLNKDKKQQKEVKEVKKKKECKHTCPFSMM